MERTCELIKQAKEGNKEAQSILVEENSGLIWSVVKRFQGRGYDKEDLFQIGSIGLLKCIENFDLERKYFSSVYELTSVKILKFNTLTKHKYIPSRFNPSVYIGYVYKFLSKKPARDMDQGNQPRKYYLINP